MPVFIYTMKILSLIFIFAIASTIHAQLLKVDYELERHRSFEDSFSEEFKEKIREQEKKPEKYTLYYADGDSFFKNLPVPIVRHENAPVTIGDNTIVQVEMAIIAPVKVYRKKGDINYYHYFEESGEKYYKISNLKMESVDYKDETQMIDKFLCKLVEITNARGERIKIWYAEDIPISTGPFMYGGFPGLILKLEAPTFVIYATKISDDLKKDDVEKMDSKLPIKK